VSALRDRVLMALADGAWRSMPEIGLIAGRSSKDGSLRRAVAALVDAGDVERDGAVYRCTVEVPAGAGTVPDGTVEVPVSPAGLGEAGRATWAAAWAVSWAKAPDAAGITHLCRLEDEATALVATIEEQGLTLTRPIVAPKGDVVGEERVMHPAVGELRRLDAQLVTLRATLGLDPASRARIGLQALDRKPDALDELRERRRERLAQAGVQA
jgi:hypothetical protein